MPTKQLVFVGIYYYMTINFSQLKKMDVISVTDGKNLGKVCDAALSFPENIVIGLVATGGNGFSFHRETVFLPMKNIVKIGEDVVLTNIYEKPPKEAKPPQNCVNGGIFPLPKPPQNGRRSYDEYE